MAIKEKIINFVNLQDMLDVLKFIFSGFWHFIGFAALLSITAHGLGHMFTIRIKNIHGDVFDDEESK